MGRRMDDDHPVFESAPAVLEYTVDAEGAVIDSKVWLPEAKPYLHDTLYAVGTEALVRLHGNGTRSVFLRSGAPGRPVRDPLDILAECSLGL